MSSLKETLKPKSIKSTSNKTPKFYNEEKNRCIVDMASDKNPIIRTAIAKNSHTPTKVLTAMLDVEQDKQVLRAVLFNSKLPRKSVASFVNSDDQRIAWFNDDVELIQHFTQE